MSVSRFFKAYDLRGTTPELTQDVYYWTGFGLISKILRPQNLPTKVLIMRDCRLTSPEFYAAFAKGIIAAGGNAILLGIGSTDTLYAASIYQNLPGAIITASHNPKMDNGLKIVKQIPQMLGLSTGLSVIRDFVIHKIEVEKAQIDWEGNEKSEILESPNLNLEKKDYPKDEAKNLDKNMETKNEETQNSQNLSESLEIERLGLTKELTKSEWTQLNSGEFLENAGENTDIKKQVMTFFVDKIKEVGQVEKTLKNLQILKNNSQNNFRLKIVVDTANGMGGFIMPYLEKIYGESVEFVPLFWELDGNFPNHPADPMSEQNLVFLKAKIRETGANFGVAMDGDADRAFFVDELGNLINGEYIVPLFAENLLEEYFQNSEKEKNNLKTETVFKNSNPKQNPENNLKIQNLNPKTLENELIQSKIGANSQNLENTKTEIQNEQNLGNILKNSENSILGLEPAIVFPISYSRATGETTLANNGIPVLSLQGHTFIKEKMKKYKAIYGGEASGHNYFGQFGFMDSGAITIALFIKIWTEKNLETTTKASQICQFWNQYFVSGEHNFRLPSGLNLQKVKQIIRQNFPIENGFKISELDGITVYSLDYKFTIRGSNTEPLLRINTEFKGQNKALEILEKLKKLLEIE